jgi:hypothetical protein
MTSASLHEQQARATAFAAEHLDECVAELIEMAETSILPAGRVRELAALCGFVGSNHLTYAINEVQRQVLLHHAAQTQAKKAFSAADYAQQQVAVARQRNDELRDDSKWRLDVWFYHGGTPFHELTPYGIASAAWDASRAALAQQVNEQLEDAGQDGMPVLPA